MEKGERASDIEPLYERPNRCNMLAETVRAYIGFESNANYSAMKDALAAFDSGHPTSWVFRDGQVVRDSTD